MEATENHPLTLEDASSSRGFSDLGDDVSLQQGLPLRTLGNSALADDGENSEMGTDMINVVSRPRGQSSVILQLDGANFTEWKVLISSLLDSVPYALDVTTGKLIPPRSTETSKEAGIQKRKYEEGNRAARYILFSSLQPALAVSLFAETSETVEAPEMYRIIVDKFSQTNGGLKQLALSKLTHYKYDQSKPAGALLRFNQIIRASV